VDESDGDGRRSDGERRTTEPVGTVSVVQMLARACDVLRDAKRILLTSHRRPDGDGTGSRAGLASLLRAQGKEAIIYSVDPIARRYKWLPLVSGTVHTISFDEVFDCTIVVDCADVSLLGDTVMRFRRRVGERFERINTPLAPRSAYLLDGPARLHWEHSLPEAKAHRYSITFRNLRAS
jgi:hypothetical protein